MPDKEVDLRYSLTRRDVLKIFGGNLVTAASAVALKEGYDLTRKGLTISHLLNVLSHLLRNPELGSYYKIRDTATKEGPSTPDFQTFTTANSPGGAFGVQTSEIKGNLANGQERLIIAHAISFAKDAHVSVASSPNNTLLTIPFLRINRPHSIVQSERPGDFASEGALGGLSLKNNTVVLHQGPSPDLHQLPFVFTPDHVPSALAQDTYIWTVLAETDNTFSAMVIDPNVRVRIPDQLEIFHRMLTQKGETPQLYALTAKGSSNGIGVDGTSLGSPLSAARENGLFYLNVG